MQKAHSPEDNRTVKRLFSATLVAFGILASLSAHGQQGPTKWGLTVFNINNPITPIVATNSDGSISITAGGGDTYDNPDSFTYAYQQVTGDFDIRVQVINVVPTDPVDGDSSKGALMVRASLDSVAADFQMNATPLLPASRNGEIESIARMSSTGGTDDIPGRMQKYGGDCTDAGYATYPDCWLRVQRQGERLISYFATANTTDYPAGWASNPGSTNGWQVMCIVHAGTNFPKTLYVGLSTVCHNGDINDTTRTVTSTYANYGPTPTPPSNPSVDGAPALPGTGPGAFPNTKVMAANFDASIAADGMGYPPDIVQSAQGAPAQIIWNSGGFGGVARDMIADISGQTPGGFSFARYQAGAFDFLLNPRDPATAWQNLGSYTNSLRERYSGGNTSVPASQAWAPSPNYGCVYTTVRKNGQQWHDTSAHFYAATYVAMDPVASAKGYDMVGGHFRGAQFYTRTTKLVTGATDPSSDRGNLQRCAMPISVAWFPYDQGWKAGYIDNVVESTGIPAWNRGNGWGLNSGTALTGYPNLGGQGQYNAPSLVTWLEQYYPGTGIYQGLANLSLVGVNSVNDGMLFTTGNNENNSTRGPSASNAALPDGSGWHVAVRDIETSKTDPTVYATGGGNDAGTSFSFVYIPYSAGNLIGGHIAASGTKIKGAGNFTVTRLSTGRYALTIPGKTGADGALLLQNTGYLANQPVGYTNVVDNSYLSYEYGGTNTPANAFIIETRYVDASGGGGGEGVVALRDAEFNFVFVDFLNPLTPTAVVVPAFNPPVLSNGQLTISWTGTGTLLQSDSLAKPMSQWTSVTSTSPYVVTPAAGAPRTFYRLQH